jgi:hypothetical protein
MTNSLPRSREHRRLVDRIVALAESYGATELEALTDDMDVIVRVEYLAFEKARKAAYERRRRAEARVEPKSLSGE